MIGFPDTNLSKGCSANSDLQGKKITHTQTDQLEGGICITKGFTVGST